MAPPIRSAKPIAARAPATSVPRPAMSGQRLAASSLPASATARSSAAALPSIHALAIPKPPSAGDATKPRRSAVVLDVGETLVLLGRALERAAFLAGLPVHDVL